MFKKKKQLVPPPSIYIHMWTLHTYMNKYVCRDFVQLDSSGPATDSLTRNRVLIDVAFIAS